MYGTIEEFNFRFKRFMEVDEFVREVNAPDSEHTHTAAHNKFSDWTESEFKKMLSPKPEYARSGERREVEQPISLHGKGDVSNGSKDWRDSGCVTAVKD